jgi:hypothetical protein
MAEGKSSGKFFVYCGLILMSFLVMLPIIFSLGRRLAKAEVLVLLFLILLSLIGFMAYKKNWGERVLFFMFLISLGNLIFIRHFTNKLFMVPLFLGLVGFLMSLPKKDEAEKIEEEQLKVEPYSEIFEEPAKPIPQPPKKKPKTKFNPGKYVASKMGSVYHEPKCEWAKKIVAKRRIWFKDKREAQRKKYKAHKCVK